MKDKRQTNIIENTWKKILGLLAGIVAIGGVMVGTFYFGTSEEKVSGELSSVVFPTAYAFDDYDARQSVREANPVEESFLMALDEFTWKTTAEFLVGSEENVNYSPLSLYYALALAASGAEGETKKELLALLGVEDKQMLSEQCGNLYRLLHTDNEIGKLKLANSLWLDRRGEFKDSYVENVAKNFYASSFQVDFTDKKTGELMSQWVAKQTNGTLNPEFSVSTQQIMAILNTVYFKDEWTSRFLEDETATDSFYLADGTSVECEFMNKVDSSAVFKKGEGFTSAELELKNAGSVILILPDEGVTPQELLENAEKVQGVFEGGERCAGRIIWQIPKFDFGSSFKLADGLKALGVQSAFDENADFSGITDDIAFISDVRQETHIAIDEKGVEASAYTVIEYCGAMMVTDEAHMILNRPFIYGVYSNQGTLLFVGICENPV